jgi:hypothetical protein
LQKEGKEVPKDDIEHQIITSAQVDVFKNNDQSSQVFVV